ncbi:hypothetical protein YC2023_024949 [Brassica napus]
MIGEVQISNAYDSSKIFINPDIQEAQAFRKIDSGDSLAITISDSGDNKLDKKLVSHKWMQCQEKNLAELVESTELEEDADFPDAITTLIGQTFTFGVYVEKDNASAEGVCYKVGKVWKDLKLLKIGDNSESGSAPSSSFVSEAPLLLQDNEPNEAASTPSSKRKNEENKDTPDKTSTSKKLCTKVIKKEKK